jgi:hypothetical protein
MIMENEFVPYNETYGIRELGFNEPCIKLYQTDKNQDTVYTEKYSLITPLFSQVFKWFREKYSLTGFVDINIETGYYFKITDIPNGEYIQENEYSSFEGAEIACLRKLIELVKK